MVRKESGLALTLGAFPEAEVSSFVVRPSQPKDSDAGTPTSERMLHPTSEEQLEEQGALAGGWKVIGLGLGLGLGLEARRRMEGDSRPLGPGPAPVPTLPTWGR